MDPWFWREGGFVRSHLGASLLMRLALQVPGELVVMAMGTRCQCTEEEGSRWLLGCCRAEGVGRPRQGRLNPKTPVSSFVGAGSWQTSGLCDRRVSPYTFLLPLLSPFHSPWRLSMRRLPQKALHCYVPKIEQSLSQRYTHVWPPFPHPSSPLV